MNKFKVLTMVLLLAWQVPSHAQEAAARHLHPAGDPAAEIIAQLSPESEMQPFREDLARLTVEEAQEALKDLDTEAIEAAAAEIEADLANGELGLSDEERTELERMAEELKGLETLSDLGKLAGPQSPAAPLAPDVPQTPDHTNQEDNTVMLALLLPIFAVVFVFGTPALIVALLLRNNQRRAALLHDTIGKLIEADKDIPPDLFQALNPAPSPNAGLYRGIIVCGAGVGLGLAAFLMRSSALAALGLVAGSVGLALLLTWKLEQNEQI